MNAQIQSLIQTRDEAQVAVNAAQRALIEAENALYSARVIATGLIGKIVEGHRRFRIVVQDVGLNSSGDPVKVRGKLLNRDGSASHEDRDIWLCMPHKVSEFLNDGSI